jgi:DNA-binding CsgD family transcriptional regulator
MSGGQAPDLVRSTDLAHLVGLFPSIYALQSVDTFPRHMIGVLGGLIDTDTISFNRVNFEQRKVEVLMEPEATMRSISDFDLHASAVMREHPLIAHSENTGATGVMRLSDFTTSRELHRTRLYSETFRPLGIEYLVSASTPIERGVQVVMVFTREGRDFDDNEMGLARALLPHFARAYRNAEAVTRQHLDFETGLGVLERHAQASVIVIRDRKVTVASPRAQSMLEKFFDDEPRPHDRSLPELLARWMRCSVAMFRTSGPGTHLIPPLIVARGAERLIVRLVADRAPLSVALILEDEASGHDAAPLQAALGLSRREAEVLFWVASGKTSAEAATILALSRRTIDKHLESIFQKLGVETRTAASALAWKVLSGKSTRAARDSS